MANARSIVPKSAFFVLLPPNPSSMPMRPMCNATINGYYLHLFIVFEKCKFQEEKHFPQIRKNGIDIFFTTE